jgi:RimJ/RimL family protein N-acetyltransferase
MMDAAEQEGQGAMTQSLTTARLSLRPYRTADAASVADLIGDLSVARWLTQVPHPYAERDALDFFERCGDGSGVFGVAIGDGDGDAIGCVSIMDGDLGYWLGQPYWGRGYATEAARAVVGWHFDREQTVLESGYVLGNRASCNVLSKLGFRETGQRGVTSASLGMTVTVQRMELDCPSWKAVA